MKIKNIIIIKKQELSCQLGVQLPLLVCQEDNTFTRCVSGTLKPSTLFELVAG